MGGCPIDYFPRIVPQYDRHSHASRRNAGQHAAEICHLTGKIGPAKTVRHGGRSGYLEFRTLCCMLRNVIVIRPCYHEFNVFRRRPVSGNKSIANRLTGVDGRQNLLMRKQHLARSVPARDFHRGKQNPETVFFVLQEKRIVNVSAGIDRPTRIRYRKRIERSFPIGVRALAAFKRRQVRSALQPFFDAGLCRFGNSVFFGGIARRAVRDAALARRGRITPEAFRKTSARADI